MKRADYKRLNSLIQSMKECDKEVEKLIKAGENSLKSQAFYSWVDLADLLFSEVEEMLEEEKDRLED